MLMVSLVNTASHKSMKKIIRRYMHRKNIYKGIFRKKNENAKIKIKILKILKISKFS